jgi:MFS family permease
MHEALDQSGALVGPLVVAAVLALHKDSYCLAFAVLGVPGVFALAMGAAALAALVSGRLYDRFGLRGLRVLAVLGAAVPFLSFSDTVALVWVGALLWGAVMGIHESTMRAAVADLVPPERRGVGYGTFTAVYGLAWLVGSAAIGALYDVSIDAAILFTVAVQALAAVTFLPLWNGGTRDR